MTTWLLRQALGEEPASSRSSGWRPTASSSASTTSRTPPARSSARRSTRRRSSPSTASASGRRRASGVGRGTDDHARCSEIRFPHSLGLLYSAFTAFLGFEVNEGEYKVMGMAPYGDAALRRQGVQAHHGRGATAASWLDMDYFCFHHSTDQTFNEKFVELFGAPRDPEWHFFTPASGYPSVLRRRSRRTSTSWRERNQYYADIAASIQRVTEEIILNMAKAAAPRDRADERLCMAGGVALNSVANGRILRETPFEELFVQPAAGDGGGALGAALYGYHRVLGKPRAFVHGARVLGRGVRTGRDRAVPARRRASRYERFDERGPADRPRGGAPPGRATSIGWFQGRFEWGPRALGAPQHPRRPAARGHEGHRQHQDQVPRAVPAVRAVGAGRARPSDFFELPGRRRATIRPASCSTWWT